MGEYTGSVSDARSLYRRGFEHFAQGELEEAISLYRRALGMDGELAIAWNGLSLALARSGDLDAGIEAARKLLELEPDDPLSHTNLSRLLQQKGLIPEAEQAMAAATRLQMKQQGS
jgi:tetratricopeptide (TPR) repeat protein